MNILFGVLISVYLIYVLVIMPLVIMNNLEAKIKKLEEENRKILQFSNIHPYWIKNQLDEIIEDIKLEIESHPNGHNVGKKGCLRRITMLRNSI